MPLRFIMSMPRSVYHTIARQLSEWISAATVSDHTKAVTDKLRSVTLAKDEILVSFEFESLFTKVPVREALDVSAALLYTSG